MIDQSPSAINALFFQISNFHIVLGYLNEGTIEDFRSLAFPQRRDCGISSNHKEMPN
jgi:hypothetical protein